MGFSEAKRVFVASLEKNKYLLYTDRTEILDKNKLYSTEVSVDFVLNKIENCKKGNYHPRFSSEADDNISHIFIINGWYFKYILKDGIVNIVSIHKEEYHV